MSAGQIDEELMSDDGAFSLDQVRVILPSKYPTITTLRKANESTSGTTFS